MFELSAKPSKAEKEAIAPKLRGKSTGQAIGYKCTPRIRYPVAKKTYSQPEKLQQTA